MRLIWFPGRSFYENPILCLGFVKFPHTKVKTLSLLLNLVIEHVHVITVGVCECVCECVCPPVVCLCPPSSSAASQSGGSDAAGQRRTSSRHTCRYPSADAPGRVARTRTRTHTHAHIQTGVGSLVSIRGKFLSNPKRRLNVRTFQRNGALGQTTVSS